jgi:hypothetical protein
LVSCKTEDLKPGEIDSGKSFYPIEIGKFWIYKVDTTYYAFNGSIQSGSYFRKEKITDSLYLQEGSVVYRLEISKSLTENGPWTISTIWNIRKDNDKIIRTEENIPYVKVRFPLKSGESWDGNVFNVLQDSARIFPFTVKELGNTQVYKQEEIFTVRIEQKIDSNCINKSAFFEIYFKNIGLGYMRNSFIEYSQEGDDPCSQPISKIEQGYDNIFTLVNHGTE